MPLPVRSCLSILAAALFLVPPSFAFQSPLSDESIREAYFLGQRHDGSFARSLDKYAKQLPMPKSGPYIYSIAFLTPFIQLVRQSETHSGDYSAQQALLDHRGQQEVVKIQVRIQLTPSYGALLSEPASKGSAPILVRRPYDFWKDFQVQVSTDGQQLSPSAFHGTPDSICGRRGPCTLNGATLELEFPPDSINSDSATILVTPPEGEPVSVEFYLVSLR